MLDEFFGNIFEGHEGHIEFRSIYWQPKEKPKVIQWADSVPQAVTLAEAMLKDPVMEGYHMYYGVTPRSTVKPEGLGGGKSDIVQARCLWVDIDNKEQSHAYSSLADAITAISCDPSYIVESGNGIHAYWILDDWVSDLSLIECGNKYLSEQCGGDKVAYDVSRILRVPTSYNWKNGQKKVCRIALSTSSRYPAAKLSQFPTLLRLSTKSEVASLPTPLPKASLSFSLDRLDPLWQRYVREGIQADRNGYYVKDGRPDRSYLIFAVIKKMLTEGYHDEEIIHIMTDPQYAITEKVMELRDAEREPYIRRQLKSIKKNHFGDVA